MALVTAVGEEALAVLMQGKQSYFLKTCNSCALLLLCHSCQKLYQIQLGQLINICIFILRKDEDG